MKRTLARTVVKKGQDSYKYDPLPPAERNSDDAVTSEDSEDILENLELHLRKFRRRSRKKVVSMGIGAIAILALVYWAVV
jgi:hypothetical protein